MASSFEGASLISAFKQPQSPFNISKDKTVIYIRLIF